MSKPKILIFDIETAPMLGYIWGLWEQNVALNQLKSDWHVIAWAAKWFKGKDGTVYGPHNRVMYMDQRNAKNIEDDRKILEALWKLIDDADIIITQNGKQFDIKKVNARFVYHGMKPYSSVKHVDTKQIAKNKFGFTSNKLEYMTDKLCKKYKKLKHSKFGGFELWKACLAGDKKAWKEMEKYNKYDVLSLEELYLVFQPWDNSINLNLYSNNEEIICGCGSTNFIRYGYTYTSVGKFQRYQCKDCGAETRSRKNLLYKDKRETIRSKV
jgi:DNA polymerase elongation subunit (family B)